MTPQIEATRNQELLSLAIINLTSAAHKFDSMSKSQLTIQNLQPTALDIRLTLELLQTLHSKQTLIKASK
jgi:hypothetical protein